MMTKFVSMIFLLETYYFLTVQSWSLTAVIISPFVETIRIFKISIAVVKSNTYKLFTAATAVFVAFHPGAIVVGYYVGVM